MQPSLAHLKWLTRKKFPLLNRSGTLRLRCQATLLMCAPITTKSVVNITYTAGFVTSERTNVVVILLHASERFASRVVEIRSSVTACKTASTSYLFVSAITVRRLKTSVTAPVSTGDLFVHVSLVTSHEKLICQAQMILRTATVKFLNRRAN